MMEDILAFFDDGVEVQATISGEMCVTRGYLDRPSEEIFGGQVSVTAWELRYPTAYLPDIRRGQRVFVGGNQYEVTDSPRALTDGATSIVSLKVIA